MKYVLIDAANLFFRARHSTFNVEPEDKAGMCLHMMLTSINFIWKRFKADKMVVAFEGKSWRYKVYPDYKKSRRDTKALRTLEEQEEDKLFFDAFEDYKDFVQNHSKVISLQHPNAEADDLIARFVATHENDSHVIVSADDDYTQLISDTVTVYNPIKKVLYTKNGAYDDKDRLLKTSLDQSGKIKVLNEYVKNEPNALHENWVELRKFIKIVRGDDGDYITTAYPRITMKSTKKRIGIMECFEDRHAQGYAWNTFMSNTWKDVLTEEDVLVKDRFKRNQMLIDLTMIPEEYKVQFDECIRLAEQPKSVQTTGLKFIQLCTKYQLTRIKEYINEYLGMFLK